MENQKRGPTVCGRRQRGQTMVSCMKTTIMITQMDRFYKGGDGKWLM